MAHWIEAMSATLFKLAAVAVVGLFVVAMALFLLQRKLIFPIPATTGPVGLPNTIERLELGESYALFLPATSSAAPAQIGRSPALIFTHGNGETAFHWHQSFSALRDRGIHVLLVEYPGYAGAGGSPSSRSIERVQLAAYDALLQRPDVDPDRLVAYGRSVGGGAAALLAAQRKLAALCIESSFSSLHDLVRELGYPTWLLRDRFDVRKVVAQHDAPVWIAHGRHDAIIPFSHAKRLHAANPASELVPLTCGHNDCPRPWSELLSFLERHRLVSPERP